VKEVACVGFENSIYGSEDVRVFVVPRSECSIDPESLFLFCAEIMPHFMIPRFIDIVVDLPRTETAKVRKNILRQKSIGKDTWDCEAAGYRIKKTGIIKNEESE
jgi:crotonobetaine/carnitine-CoA ligase